MGGRQPGRTDGRRIGPLGRAAGLATLIHLLGLGVLGLVAARSPAAATSADGELADSLTVDPVELRSFEGAFSPEASWPVLGAPWPFGGVAPAATRTSASTAAGGHRGPPTEAVLLSGTAAATSAAGGDGARGEPARSAGAAAARLSHPHGDPVPGLVAPDAGVADGASSREASLSDGGRRARDPRRSPVDAAAEDTVAARSDAAPDTDPGADAPGADATAPDAAADVQPGGAAVAGAAPGAAGTSPGASGNLGGPSIGSGAAIHLGGPGATRDGPPGGPTSTGPLGGGPHAVFLAALKERVQATWRPKEVFQSLDQQGRLRAPMFSTIAEVRLRADGTVERVAVRSSSGIEALDREALDALKRASELPPVPRELLDASGGYTLPFGFHLDVAVFRFASQLQRTLLDLWKGSPAFRRAGDRHRVTRARVLLNKDGIVVHSLVVASAGIDFLDEGVMKALPAGLRLPVPPRDYVRRPGLIPVDIEFLHRLRLPPGIHVLRPRDLDRDADDR